MSNQVDTLLATFSDVYSSPKQERIIELQSELGRMDFDGIHLGAPEAVDPDQQGIPTITLSGNDMIRDWEVDDRQNAVIVAINLDRAEMRTPPLYKPPTKRLKPEPKGPKPTDLSTTARTFGARHRIVGEDGGLKPGSYSLCVIEWDRVSNIRTVVKKPKPGVPPIPPAVLPWPWELWKAQATDFQAQAGSPKLDGDAGLAVEAVGSGDHTVLLGSFATKARPIHIIASDPGSGVAKSDIRAGVPVDLLQFTLDKTAPEHLRILVPIKAAAPLKPGDVLNGWFSYPLPKLRRKDETMVYVFVDGMRSDPIRIPALKP